MGRNQLSSFAQGLADRLEIVAGRLHSKSDDYCMLVQEMRVLRELSSELRYTKNIGIKYKFGDRLKATLEQLVLNQDELIDDLREFSDLTKVEWSD